MSTLLNSWNHVPGKRIEPGTAYTFVETMRRPTSTNPYRAEVVEVNTSGEKVEMKLKVTKPDRNKRYSVGEVITRTWNKEDANSGTTLIYNNYEIGTNDYPDQPGIQFIQPE